MACLSNQCFAYERLKRQIGQQCYIYKELSETGKFGSMSDMYHQTEDGRSIPGEYAAAFLRGGLITTMACFEAFLYELVNEAVSNIKYQRRQDCHEGGTCSDCQQYLKYQHIFNIDSCRDGTDHINDTQRDTFITPLLHRWNPLYLSTFDPNDSSGSKDKDTGSKDKGTGSKDKEGTGSKDKGTGSKDKGTGSKDKEGTGSKDKGTGSKDKGTGSKDKGTGSKGKGTGSKDEGTGSKGSQQEKSLSSNPDIIKLMELDKCPINYYYLLDDQWVSHVQIKKGNVICLLLKVFYGIRCVMAHGNSSKTFEYPGALALFPNCAECIDPKEFGRKKKEVKELISQKKIESRKKNEKFQSEAEMLQSKAEEILAEKVKKIPINDQASKYKPSESITETLKNISILSDKYDECIKKQGKCKVLKTARKFPRKKPLGNDAIGTRLLQLYFPDCEYIDQRLPQINFLYEQRVEILKQKKDMDLKLWFTSDDKEGISKKKEKLYEEYCGIDQKYWKLKLLDENYAFFHLCRIHHWLKEDEREAYVTYNMLVRINQFILLLAHRMRFAVAKHMMDHFGLEDGIWHVPKNEKDRKEKIEKFEIKHKKKVYQLQKSSVPSSKKK